MATFGQLIPPKKIVLDVGTGAPEVMDRLQFFRRLCRCLAAVGMEFHSAASLCAPQGTQVMDNIILDETHADIGLDGYVAVFTFPQTSTTLTTSALTAASGTVLNFAANGTNAVPGMTVSGTGIVAGTYVTASTATTVTLSTPSVSGVASGAVITFSADTFDRVYNYGNTTYTVPYRPCVLVCMSSYYNTAALAGNADYSPVNIYLEAGAIPWGNVGPFTYGNSVDLGDTLTYNGLNAVTGQAQGYNANVIYNLTVYGSNYYTQLSANRAGLRVYRDNWKPATLASSGSVGSLVNTLSVGYWNISLGPGGLHVMVGSDSRNKMSIMNGCFMFFGERVPNRSLLPDPDIRTVCPVAYFPLQESNLPGMNPLQLRIPYYRHVNRNYAPATTFAPQSAYWDSAARGEALILDIRPFNRQDAPFNSNQVALNVDSVPVKLISGSPRYPMQRLIGIPSYGNKTGTGGYRPGDIAWWDDYNGGVNNVIRSNWDDFYHFPSIRVIGNVLGNASGNVFAQAGAWPGNLTNPDDSSLWRVVPWQAGNYSTLLFKVTGETTYTNLPASWSYGSTTEVLYDITSVPSGALPLVSPGMVGSPPVQAATALLTSPSNMFVVAPVATDGTWVKAAPDTFKSTMATAGSYTAYMSIWLDVPASIDSQYDLFLKLDVRIGLVLSGSVQIVIYFPGRGPSAGIIVATITNNDNAFHTYGPYNVKFYLPSGSPQLNAANRPVFTVGANHVSGGTQVVDVKNIKLSYKLVTVTAS